MIACPNDDKPPTHICYEYINFFDPCGNKHDGATSFEEGVVFFR